MNLNQNSAAGYLLFKRNGRGDRVHIKFWMSHIGNIVGMVVSWYFSSHITLSLQISISPSTMCAYVYAICVHVEKLVIVVFLLMPILFL